MKVEANKESGKEKEAFESKASGKRPNASLAYVFGGILLAIVIIGVIYLMVSSSSANVVAVGDNVSVYYTGSFTNGTVFGTNVGGAPFNFTVGSGQVIKGFSNALIGMSVGENKTVTIPPSEAYGEVNQSLIQNIPLSLFKNATVKAGMIVTSPQGYQGRIISVGSENATVDFNPPLAGYTLVFNIKVVSIRK
ncbi:MAG: FKBP-type peptidyl-prolyl cis-trans isomerase [Candidatus Micrarchaeia archaeon]